MQRFVFVLPIAMVCLAVATASSAEPTAAQLRFFETKIRPVLVERCYKCHSAKSAKVKGQLLLDSQAPSADGEKHTHRQACIGPRQLTLRKLYAQG